MMPDVAPYYYVLVNGARMSKPLSFGKAHSPKISGYATPKPSLVATSFEASFDLERTTYKSTPA
jgi:hypothetical protein